MHTAPPPRVLASDYMRFAKQDSGARYGLASSGIADCVLADLDPSLDALALHGPNSYGYGPLVERIARRFSIPEACVVTAGGASFANHLAMAALLEPGDEVLVEDPTYELLTSTLGYHQARLRQVSRRPERGWRLDPDAVISAITPSTKLIVLTNPHNPTGALADDAEIEAIAGAAARVGAVVLIDEVYRELLFDSGEARTSFRTDGNIVVTSSLTKAYGLSGLRCGWILAPAREAQAMRRLNDLFASLPPHIAECLSVTAFDRLPALRVRANALLEANHAAYRETLWGHQALEHALFPPGTTAFPRLRHGDGDALLSRLKTDFGVSIAPGGYFGRPNHIRVGLGGEPLATRAGLTLLAEALSS